ncbi:HlyD family efflux transporter periplasmic adaptor subunit [Paraburkholderia sp. CNPSo 3281]|uniref:HlyD family secretion protein n=1 Tax=Paraburkholderia sp. CNPSo 3281 TaxID=2940933 RepID=UPI0020B707C1|nr:HlyD family efflux transporter periplasmic adaptor subunit [Paraburkholderia sp. CNPSo 3281]MCP3717328.1 HlyD family efflux transporter periplasmic adaptor subunit [Paraburkholderia sp. CNPSo 3281]
MSESNIAERTDARQSQPNSDGSNATPAGAEQNATQPASSGKRKLWLALLGIGTVVAGAAYGSYYFTVGQYHESTDDAYVNGNLVLLTPQVTGTVNAVNTDDTQIVKVGEPVVTLDPADSRITLLKAEAALGQAVRKVSTLYVNNDYYAANIAQRESDLVRAKQDLQRRIAVANTGAVSAEDVSHAQDTVNATQAALDAARQQAMSNLALTDRTSIEQHPDVQAAATKVRDAYLNYARNVLPAPVTGYVAQRSVQVGQRVAPGTPLLSIVPLDGVWVDANFKEVQLRRMRIGQPVTMTADVYGSSVVYHGRVIGFSAGSGSAFATLPAQNATGNWIKIVQRLPVRIQLDPKELEAHPLRIGLSMDVDVETRNDDGTQLGAAVKTTYHTDVFAQYGAQADAEIARIVEQNEVVAQIKAVQPAAKNVAMRITPATLAAR